MAIFRDDFGGATLEGAALDDLLPFTAAAVALAPDNFTCEDDVFEVEDRAVVIFKLVRCVGRDDIAERPDQLA